MKLLTASRTLDIPEGVVVEIKARRVRVKGPRGTLQKDFKHLDVDAYLVRPRPVAAHCPPATSKQPHLPCAIFGALFLLGNRTS